MHKAIAVIALVGLVAAPLGAQGRARGRNGNGVPPGQQPRPGECRVWYEGVPPGRQPAPTSCREAERIAARDSRARVIYGSDTGRGRDRDRGSIYGRDSRYPQSDRGWGGWGRQSVAFDQGTRDGVTKGEEDLRKNRSADPVRHSWYRSADRGYNSRYGTRDEYRDAYRAGFERGYEDGYYSNGTYRDGTRGGVNLPWPF